jgi:PAS domain S-box-containing protein
MLTAPAPAGPTPFALCSTSPDLPPVRPARPCSAELTLAQLTRHLPTGLLLLSPGGQVELVTDSFLAQFGLPAQAAQWVGQPSAALLATAQQQVISPAAPFALATAPKGRQLLTLHHGPVLSCEITPTATGGWLLSVADVSEEQRRLTELESIRRLVELGPNPVVRIGANQQQLYANAVARRLGRQQTRAEQVLVQRRLRAHAAAALAQQPSDQPVEVSMGEQTFRVMVMPVPERGYVNLYFHDVTERDAVRQQLQEQQQFMEEVLDTIPTTVFVRDANHKLIFQNQAMRHLVADTPILGNWANAGPNSSLGSGVAEYTELYKKVLSTGEEVIREESFTLADGLAHQFYTIRRPLRRPDGTVHVLGVSTDITALKQAQCTLERSEKQYRDLLHYTQALICTYDLQGNILSVNPAFSTLLGQPSEALLGQSMGRHLVLNDQQLFADCLRRIASMGEDKGVVQVQPHSSGAPRHLLYHSFTVREADQKPYVISHAHDITDRVLAEGEMRRARVEAEKAVQARENFLANMSHEIRTPMNGVLGVANLLARTTLTPQQQEYLSTIRSSGQHLLAILNDVLDMAKISSGKLEFNPEPVNLCDSIGQAVQPLALQAQEKGIEFMGTPLRASCPYPWVLGDAHRINQILLNLVSNAIKFTPRGGRIQVSCTLVADTADTLTIQFMVQDSGLGMTPEVLARIFESFTQAYADTARRFGGTGLGLSISRALVEQMGGTLEAESAPGQGSTFHFTLTLPRAAAQKLDQVEEDFDTGLLRGVRALLVEDNEINRYVARGTMEEWGVVVDEAESGTEALVRFEEVPYDIVLMDIQMPGMSGLEAAAHIRQHPEEARAQVPIIALTANAFRADHEQYLASGMDDCLAKPFEEAELYARLRALLRR